MIKLSSYLSLTMKHSLLLCHCSAAFQSEVKGDRGGSTL